MYTIIEEVVIFKYHIDERNKIWIKFMVCILQVLKNIQYEKNCNTERMLNM